MSRAKLIRDNIPEIIQETGAKPMTRIARTDEFLDLLRDKLVEEVGEFIDSGDPQELADVLEVLLTLAEEFGVDLEKLRDKKAAERGRFAKRIVWFGNERLPNLSATHA